MKTWSLTRCRDCQHEELRYCNVHRCRNCGGALERIAPADRLALAEKIAVAAAKWAAHDAALADLLREWRAE